MGSKKSDEINCRLRYFFSGTSVAKVIAKFGSMVSYNYYLQCHITCTYPIPGVPEKAERRIFSTLQAKGVICFYIIRLKHLPQKNDTKISKLGLVILILCPFLELQSFSNFAWFLRPTSEELWREKPSIYTVYCGSPLCFFCCHGSMGFPKTPYGSLVPTQFFAHRSEKSCEIWKWLYFK